MDKMHSHLAAMKKQGRLKKKPKLGSGARFKKLKGELAAKGASDPGALAAWIGRKKYGKGRFQKLAAKGK